MEAKIELKKTRIGTYFFNLKIGNGEIVLTSEMYEQKSTAEFDILSLKTLSSDGARYERKTTTTGSPFLSLKPTTVKSSGIAKCMLLSWLWKLASSR